MSLLPSFVLGESHRMLLFGLLRRTSEWSPGCQQQPQPRPTPPLSSLLPSPQQPHPKPCLRDTAAKRRRLNGPIHACRLCQRDTCDQAHKLQSATSSGVSQPCSRNSAPKHSLVQHSALCPAPRKAAAVRLGQQTPLVLLDLNQHLLQEWSWF